MKAVSLLVLTIVAIGGCKGCNRPNPMSLGVLKSENNIPPIEEAAMMGDITQIKELARNGANLNGGPNAVMTPLAWAAALEKQKVVNTLIKLGANVNARSNAGAVTAIWEASRKGNMVIAESLVNHGADVNTQDSVDGYTPLMCAAENNHMQMSQYLVSHGADIGLKSKKGKTAEQIAREHGHEALANWLKQASNKCGGGSE